MESASLAPSSPSLSNLSPCSEWNARRPCLAGYLHCRVPVPDLWREGTGPHSRGSLPALPALLRSHLHVCGDGGRVSSRPQETQVEEGAPGDWGEVGDVVLL